MSNRLSPLSRFLLRLLADGQPHTYEDVKRALMDQVPPGKAFRTFQVRDAARINRVGPRKRPEMDQAQQIQAGKGIVANQTIWSMSQNYILIEDHGLLGDRTIRLRPEHIEKLQPAGEPPAVTPVIEPGALPVAEAPQPIGVTLSVEAEARIRDIVGEEVGHAFDQLENDLGVYLDDWCKKMERLLLNRRDNNRPHGKPQRQDHGKSV